MGVKTSSMTTWSSCPPLERVGETEAAHDEIGTRRAAAIELVVDMLPLAEDEVGRQ
jgi:hypothetical protein